MKISVSELEIYKNNPEKIENLANPEKVRYRFLLTIFICSGGTGNKRKKRGY